MDIFLFLSFIACSFILVFCLVYNEPDDEYLEYLDSLERIHRNKNAFCALWHYLPDKTHHHCPCGCGAHMGCLLYEDQLEDK